MPGPISNSSSGPPEDGPYVPSWCYPNNSPRICVCGHHEDYHSDHGECLHAHYFTNCECTGFKEIKP